MSLLTLHRLSVLTAVGPLHIRPCRKPPRNVSISDFESLGLTVFLSLSRDLSGNNVNTETWPRYSVLSPHDMTRMKLAIG